VSFFLFAVETVLSMMSFIYHFNAEAADLLQNLSLDSEPKTAVVAEPAKKVCIFAIELMHLKLWLCCDNKIFIVCFYTEWTRTRSS